MAITFTVGDRLPRLNYQASSLQLFRFSGACWNSHRIHYDEGYARSENHDGIVVHSSLRAALALQCVTDAISSDWRVDSMTYRLRKPIYAPVDLSYEATVTEANDDAIALQISEDHPSGEVGFEGRVTLCHQPRRVATKAQDGRRTV